MSFLGARKQSRNEEEVARAIRGSAIPVISAVGHETDVTIADFVADLRAATPSAAAELVAAQEDQIRSALESLGRNLSRLMRFKIIDARTRVQEHALSHAFNEVRGRLRDAQSATNSATHELQILMNQSMNKAHAKTEGVLRRLSPVRLQTRFSRAQMRLASAAAANQAAIENRFAEAGKLLGLAAASLDALSPLGVLQRGYAIAQDEDGNLLRDAQTVPVGSRVGVRLAKGRLLSRVESVEK